MNIGCDTNAFFGNYGAENPTFTLSETCTNINYSALIIQLSNITSDNTFYLLYGYIANSNGVNKYSMDELIKKYNNMTLLKSLQKTTAKQFYDDAIKFNTSNYPEISREILWCYGMMRSSLSFYNLMNETILDQGTYYRYVSGGEYALRDPIIHALPLIYTNPEIFKSIIRFSLKEIQPPFDSFIKDHNLPYGIIGNGAFYGGFDNQFPSDLEITMLWVVAEYILQTKDVDFLNETIDLNVFMNDVNANHKHTILDCLLELYGYLSSYIGVGKHGVFRLQTGDLSDTFVILSTKGIAGYNNTEIVEQGESGLNTPMLAYILPRFYDILQSINVSYPEIQQFGKQQADVLRDTLWNGQWINRGWVPFNNTPQGVWMGTAEENRYVLNCEEIHEN